jgi:hypothetical protein
VFSDIRSSIKCILTYWGLKLLSNEATWQHCKVGWSVCDAVQQEEGIFVKHKSTDDVLERNAWQKICLKKDLK